MDLVEFIKTTIMANGPMSFASFMKRVLQCETFGYYKNKQAVGKEGDFITAPEITQLFGEMIGVWCVSAWEAMGKPTAWQLIELGPGRGTLMADILRATKHVPEFQSSMKICLVDINDTLITEQAHKIDFKNLAWYKNYNDIPKNISIILSNEFFDALPVEQYVKKDDKWHINMVDVHPETEDLYVTHFSIKHTMQDYLQNTYAHIANNGVLEICDEAEILMKTITQDIVAHGGAMLCVDYGYVDAKKERHASTIQAIRNHEYAPIFKYIGETDISSHVNFTALSNTSTLQKGFVCGPITQREFLLNMGIDLRKDMLLKSASSEEAKATLLSSFERLTSPKQMGDLFKVMAVFGKKIEYKAGF